MAKSLLVIDDSSTIREATQLALTGGEWELVTATSGAEAMDALQQHRVDVILCAVAPGEEDGYELCRRLGASAEGSGTPMLLMGGNVNATAALAVGASATLPKPFTAEQLRQALQETLEQSDFSFDFDHAPVAEADDTPLDLDLLAEEFELEPAEGTGGPLESEEIEVIDLSDDDQFDDLELLDDLEPVELGPLKPVPGVDLPGDLDLGAPGDEGTDDLSAGPSAVTGAEDSGAPTMEFTKEIPQQTEADRQAPAAEWTVDGLMLGGDESPANGGEPDLPSDTKPTLPDPFPALDEEDWTEAGQKPSEDAEVGPDPQDGVDDADVGFAAESEPAASAYDAAEAPDTDLLDDFMDELSPEPAQAKTFSDLELEWAREVTPAKEDTFPPEDADPDIALEELPQPAATEPEAPPTTEPGTPLHHKSEALRGEAGDANAWDLPTAADSVPPAYSPDADPSPPDEPSATGAAEPAVPVDLAASVAASAGQAVREALEKSLSAEHLAPLVEAAVGRVAWEVVPQLAERLIRETIARLQQEPPTT